ncbi:DUF3888 domain-containing protein [Salinithrix halophila]|uniref:DUF3888 domain-containing protein n=1 Tax=Salinithrix halophila TaxID=1485204 RepID=A0ABV8JDZ1_9BACL
MKAKFPTVLLMCLALLLGGAGPAKDPLPSGEKLKEVLRPALQNAIVGHYGEPREIRGMKILHMNQLQSEGKNFLVKVRVETHKGTPRLTRGWETVTMRVGSDRVDVLKYQHRNVPSWLGK